MAKSKALIAAEERIAELEAAAVESQEKVTTLEVEAKEAEGDMIELVTENKMLKEMPKLSQEEQELADARLTNAINEMEMPTIVGGQVTGNTKIKVFTPTEYKEFTAKKGQHMGRPSNWKTECTIEELRATINAGRSPSWLMAKHGTTQNEMQQLVWQLSKKELRDNPIRLDFVADVFGQEG